MPPIGSRELRDLDQNQILNTTRTPRTPRTPRAPRTPRVSQTPRRQEDQENPPPRQHERENVPDPERSPNGHRIRSRSPSPPRSLTPRRRSPSPRRIRSISPSPRRVEQNITPLRERRGNESDLRVNALSPLREIEETHTPASLGGRAPTISPRSADLPLLIEGQDPDAFEENLQPHENRFVNALRGLNLRRATSQELRQNEITRCDICHEHFTREDEAVILSFCGHIFGRYCLEYWIANNYNCPNRCNLTMENRVINLELAGIMREDQQQTLSELEFRRIQQRQLADARDELERVRRQVAREQPEQEREQVTREQVARERAEREQFEQVQLERELLEEVRAEREQAERERAEQEDISMRDISPPSQRRAGERQDAVLPSPIFSDSSFGNPDWEQDYLNRRPVRGVESPRGYVISEDRSAPGNRIYKKVIDVFPYQNRGYHLLLRSPSCNPDYTDLYVYDLEAQSLHPGAFDEFGRPGRLGEQHRLNLHEFRHVLWVGVASVKQDVRPMQVAGTSMTARVLPTKVYTIIGLRTPNGFEAWYKQEIAERQYGPDKVKAQMKRFREKTGQGEPLLSGSRNRRFIEIVERAADRDERERRERVERDRQIREREREIRETEDRERERRGGDERRDQNRGDGRDRRDERERRGGDERRDQNRGDGRDRRDERREIDERERRGGDERDRRDERDDRDERDERERRGGDERRDQNRGDERDRRDEGRERIAARRHYRGVPSRESTL